MYCNKHFCNNCIECAIDSQTRAIVAEIAKTKPKEKQKETWRAWASWLLLIVVAGFVLQSGIKAADWVIPDPPRKPIVMETWLLRK